jgi:hypothetical protein
VPGGGIEPPQAFWALRILSPLRLPISPSRLIMEVLNSTARFALYVLLAQDGSGAVIKLHDYPQDSQTANAFAVARPNPDAAPGTSATLFSKDSFMNASSICGTDSTRLGDLLTFSNKTSRVLSAIRHSF